MFLNKSRSKPQRVKVGAMILPLLVFSLVGGIQINTSAQSEKLNYPQARRVAQVDTYHGIEMADPYRWMEDMNSEETRRWMKAQDRLLEDFLKNTPALAALRKRIEYIGNLGDSYASPYRAGSRYFTAKVVTGKNRPFIYVQESLDSKPRLLMDANTYFEDEEIRFGNFTPSPDGRLLAFGATRGQSLWASLKILVVENGKERPESLTGLRASNVAWDGESRGFFYIRYGEHEQLESGKAKPRPEIYYHRVGTDQSNDVPVYARPDRPEWIYSITVTEEGRYLIIQASDGNDPRNRVFYKDLKSPDGDIVELITEADAAYSFLNNEGSLFWFYTDLNAPRGRIISIDLARTQREHWKEVVPEAEEAMAGGSGVGGNAVNVVGNRFVILYRKDVRPLIRIFNLKGRLEREVQLPIGYVGGGFVAKKGDRDAFFTMSRIFHANTVYRLNLKTGKISPYHQQKVPLNPDDFEVGQVFYQSKDGTRVPMFIAHKKGLKLDGHNPVFMYGYGYAGWVAIPWYQPFMLAWMEMGGVYAMPNIRGGGEYGKTWEVAGIGLNRQKAIDDFIAAAEWLIANKYTSPSKMISNGGSASGALAAAAAIQRPELFGAAIIDIPTLDMMRYHEHTVFKGWTKGFGSSDDPEEFKVLRSYSPYHNIKPEVCYPPMLVTVGERDQGAPPLHGYKFVAAMQANQKCDNPALLKIVWGAGHSFGTTAEQMWQTQAEQLAFLVRVLGLDASLNHSGSEPRR